MTEIVVVAAVVLGLAGTTLGVASCYMLHPRSEARHDELEEEIRRLRERVRVLSQPRREQAVGRPTPAARPVTPLTSRTDTVESAVVVDETAAEWARRTLDEIEAKVGRPG